MNRSVIETRRISIHRIDGRNYYQFNLPKQWVIRMGLDKSLTVEVEWNDELILRSLEMDSDE